MSESLLYAMSTLGPMSLSRFYTLFDACFPHHEAHDEEASPTKARNQLVRFLGSLGHCEFDFEARNVFTCPPSLVSLPGSGLPKAVLTGARTPSLMGALRAAVKESNRAVSLSESAQTFRSPFLDHSYAPRLELPHSVVFEATELNELEGLAKAATIHSKLGVPAAWLLATFSAGLPAVEENLRFDPFRDLNWRPRYAFDPETLSFPRVIGDLPDDALVAYESPINHQLRHIIRYKDQEAVIDRDWGRYHMLVENGRGVLFYERRQQQLVVPSRVPLPRLLARAATLCSGFAPLQGRISGSSGGQLPLGTPVDVYRAVPYAVASQVAEKLSHEHLTVLDAKNLEVVN